VEGVPADTISVFVNYRQEDTAGQAQALSDRLKERFGSENVHFEAGQQSGVQWLQEAEASGSGRRAFLALIGPDWLSSVQAHAAFSTRVEDFARREIQWVLQEWSGLVIPVLVDAQMPPPEILPRSLRGLCRHQAAQLRSASFGADVEHLIELLEQDPGTVADAQAGEADAQELAQRSGIAAASGVPAPTHDHYVEVVRGIIEGTVVPLLGPSVRGALPDADYMAGRLADKFQIKRDTPDLAEIAQRVLVTESKTRLYGAIKDIMATASKPTPVHHFLAGLPKLLRTRGLDAPPMLIISTNYDWALERAFEAANEPFDYVVYMAHGGRFVHFPWGEYAGGPTANTINEPGTYFEFPISEDLDVDRTIIVKINGAADGAEGEIKFRDNYVITEDHYIDYLPTKNHLPTQLLAKLTSSQCLFIGYTLHDWNARVLLRRIWPDNMLSESSWAIAPHPDLFEKKTWGAIGNVELLAAHATDYVRDLRALLETWPESSGA
jgi:hypothetical protein